MTITFLSNYINHHQIPFCEACYELLGEDFCFVQARPMEQERIDMGWHTDGTKRPYVRCFYEEEEACHILIEECDVLLAGWSGLEEMVQKRLLTGKPVIRISERIYREGRWKAVSPRGLWHKYKEHFRFRNKNAYLLCAGAYVAGDFKMICCYPGKLFRWGYFPETITYTRQQWEGMKRKEGTLSIIWAGRFIPLKHPEMMIRLAADLKEKKQLWQNRPFTDFHIHMAGSGEMEQQLRELAVQKSVEDKITFHGFMEPEQVRRLMEQSHIHVFTSNQLEGWGAVVNEAMNSGCVEVADKRAGAVPYLISHGENGMIYKRGSYKQLLEAVCYLIENPDKREEMSRKAYETVTTLWNAEGAAEELVRFAAEVLEGKPQAAEKGPLSRA